MKNLIVIGNGMVGHHFIEKAIEKNLHQIYQIHVFSAEKRPAYDRVYLSSYFEHKDASQLNLVDLAHYKQAGITLHLGEAVNHIDAQSKIVTTTKGEMDDSLLEKREGMIDNDNETTKWVEYWLDGELVHRSVDMTLKKFTVTGAAVASSF